jgi:predicted oxidoreductase
MSENVVRGRRFHNDEQLRRIAQTRRYLSERVRTSRFQQILDPQARPLVAIREFILTRKTLGGIQTDLGSRVLAPGGTPIPGLFAVGEAAGYGGGGMHGKGSLEGTFLGGWVLTARAAAHTLCG